MQTERTLEQMNAAQLKTIQELTQRIKDLEIWERFAAFLISDCNMKPEVLQESMEAMLAKEAVRPPTIKK